MIIFRSKYPHHMTIGHNRRARNFEITILDISPVLISSRITFFLIEVIDTSDDKLYSTCIIIDTISLILKSSINTKSLAGLKCIRRESITESE